MKIKVITKSKITELMAGHPRLVSVVLGVGLTFAVATTLSILVGMPHEAFARAPVAPLPTVDVARIR